MKKDIYALLVILIVGIGFSYTYSHNKEHWRKQAVVTPTEESTNKSSINMNGSTYRMRSFNGKDVSSKYIVTFGDGIIQAKICNTLHGATKEHDGKTYATLTSTFMMCHNDTDDIMNIENIFTTALAEGVTIRTEETLLYITDAHGNIFYFVLFMD